MAIINVLEAKMESGELYPFWSISKKETVRSGGVKEIEYTALGNEKDVSKLYSLNEEGELKFKIKSPDGTTARVEICRPLTDEEWAEHQRKVAGKYKEEVNEDS